MSEEESRPEPDGSGEDAAPESGAAEKTSRLDVVWPFFVIRESIPWLLRWALGVVPIAALLGIWWLITGSGPAEERVITPTILPNPLEVVRSFPSLWFEKALMRNLLISFYRVAVGFGFGVLIAFPLGVLMGSFTKVKAMFNPLSVIGGYLPIPALVPLTMSLLGTNDRQKFGFLALTTS